MSGDKVVLRKLAYYLGKVKTQGETIARLKTENIQQRMLLEEAGKIIRNGNYFDEDKLLTCWICKSHISNSQPHAEDCQYALWQNKLENN